VSDQDDRLRPLAFLLRAEVPAEDRLDSDHAEKRRRDVRSIQTLRLRPFAQVERPAVHGRHSLEGPVLRAPVDEVGSGGGKPGKPLRGVDRDDHHQAIGIGEGERAQEDGVDDAEDGGVGTDAQRQRQHRHRGEAGTLDQRPQPIAQILKNGVHGVS